MKRLFLLLSVLLLGPLVTPAAAQTRVIVRTTLGLPGLQSTCLLLGCTVKYGLGDPQGQLFLVTTSNLDPGSFLRSLRLQLGIVDAELDLLGKTQQATASGIPASLYDNTLVNYFGNSVWHGYVTQPASQIVRIADTQSAFNVRGSGIVAIIDTGIDPSHPAFSNVLVPGYDFTRNQDGTPSETADLSQSTAAVVDQVQPAYVNQSTAAVVDQSTAAVVDTSQYVAFGHGTMVAGVVHLVAPKAMIMPLKSFRADGTGYTSDVLRAIYRSVQNNAKVINMSFSFAAYSQELSQAVNYAGQKGVICVASAGNDGSKTIVYPAGFSSRVMSVASTTNNDTRSTFSNYGSGMVWVAAPGEGIVTTYPFGTYAAAWGTSFSAPFVSGAAALLLDINSCSESQAAKAVANAKWISYDLGNGRLDLYQAVQAWRQTLGLQ
ncbi:MAG TPA: S8 family serine peptidase [Acidobacteriota bacterium]|jgi:subtilisin family serine protease